MVNSSKHTILCDFILASCAHLLTELNPVSCSVILPLKRHRCELLLNGWSVNLFCFFKCYLNQTKKQLN